MFTALRRLRDLFRREKLVAEFTEEMQFHLAEAEAEYRRRGHSPAEAQRLAHLDFGNATRAREDLRERATWPRVEEHLRDLRFAARGLMNRPGFALGVILVLGLGFGAAALVNGLVRAVILSPLPVPSPEEIHLIVESDHDRPERLSRGTLARLEENLAPDQVAGFSGLAGLVVQVGREPATKVTGLLVTGNFFRTMRVMPETGRLLSVADDQRGAPPVAVVSQTWARERFGSSSAALGKTFSVNRQQVAVVGVLPASFGSIDVGRTVDVWLTTAQQLPLRINGNAWSIGGDDRPNDPDWNREERIAWLTGLLRLPESARAVAAGATARAFQGQLDAAANAIDTAADREEHLRRKVRVVSSPGGYSSLREGFRSTGALLAALVGVILLLACANVSGLLVVRALARHRELGVRLALGSGRWRVGRLAMAETLLLSAVGSAVGWLVALFSYAAACRVLLPGRNVPSLMSDSGQLLVMALLTVLTTAICGLGPVMLIARMEPLAAVAGRGALGHAAGRLGRWLVAAQLGLAVLLVAVAYTLGLEMSRTLNENPGFERGQVLAAVFDARAAGYDQAQFAGLFERVDATLRAVPGVSDVSFASTGILSNMRSASGIQPRDPRAPGKPEARQGDVVRPGYFRLVGMTLLSGRDFSRDDRPDTPNVVVVSAAFAREVFGDLDPIGQRLGFGTTPDQDDMTVVGVVADAKINSLREKPPAIFWRSALQLPEHDLGYLAIRTEGSVDAVRGAAQAALAQAEPGLVFSRWQTLDERMINDLGAERATSRIAGLFAAVALVLASTGVAASFSYLVSIQRRELALRLALGADPSRIRWGVLRDAARVGVIGGLAGLLAAWLLPRIPAVGALLPEAPHLVVCVIAAVCGVVVTVLSSWRPAHVAATSDPLLLLKCQ